jgi:hypothetical protein
MFSYMARNTYDVEDTESRFWGSYLVLKRATPPLAAQRRTEAVEVDVHCLVVSLHVTASVRFLVKPMARMAGSYEKVALRVETVFQELVRGETGGAEQ